MDISAYAKSIYDLMPPGMSALAYLAGGCFRSFYDRTPVKDYDLFFASYADWSLAVTFFRMSEEFTEITQDGEGQFPSFQREGHPPFNVIGFRFQRGTQALARSFDFTCCQFAAEMVDPETCEVFSTALAESDAASKTLRIANHQHIDRVIRRARKYVETYGYTTAPGWATDLDICRNTPRGEEGAYTG
jgi:hypothetical protein